MVREHLGVRKIFKGVRGKILVMAYFCLHNLHDKVKVKQSHYTPWGRRGERMYSSYSFMTSALDGVSGQRHAVAAFIPGERTHGTHWIGD
jgi:hypothetical protein